MTIKQRISIACNTEYETRNTPSQNGSTLVRRYLTSISNLPSQPNRASRKQPSSCNRILGSDVSEKKNRGKNHGDSESQLPCSTGVSSNSLCARNGVAGAQPHKLLISERLIIPQHTRANITPRSNPSGHHEARECASWDQRRLTSRRARAPAGSRGAERASRGRGGEGPPLA